MLVGKRPFLSCLYGSERFSILRVTDSMFLSCLYGSELKAGELYLHLGFSKLPVRQ